MDKVTCVEENGKWFAYCHHQYHEMAFARGDTKEEALLRLAEMLHEKLTKIYDQLLTVP